MPVVHEPPRRCQIAFPMFRKVKGAGAGGSDGDEDEDEDLDEDFNEDEAEAENESDAAFLRYVCATTGIQCPLDIATLDIAAVLPIATSTPVTNLRQYINSDFGYNDLKF